MITYVAFLRGINVGGNKQISMKDLAALFERAGFRNIKTILNSGNVVFASKESPEASLARKIEKAIQDEFGFEVGIQIRTLDVIKKLVERNPFKQFKPDKDTHWYVTFLDKSGIKLPAVTSDFYKLISIRDHALFSVLYRQKGKAPDFMAFLDKTFGKKVTTRNWNTIVRIAGIKS
jgi:uncharacterized protein (DUF1697 family)